MRCRRLQRFLLAFLEGELTPQQRQQVETHIVACPACAAALRSLEHTVGLLQTMAVHEPEEAYWEAFLPTLQQRLRQENVISSGRRSLLEWLWHAVPRPVLAALATSLLLVSALPLMRGLWQPHPTPVLVLSEHETTNALAEVDFLKHLDLLEEVDVVEDTDSAF